MKIIKQGVLSETIEVEESCSKCGTVFSYNQKDVQSDSRDGDYVVCPLKKCGAFISAKALHDKVIKTRMMRAAQS